MKIFNYFQTLTIIDKRGARLLKNTGMKESTREG